MPRPGRPSPALIVAIGAIVLACAGTAFAAATINGSQIENRSITGPKVKKATLGGVHLRSSSVGGGKIRPFTGGLIKNKTIPGTKIKDKSLTGDQIDVSKLGTVPEAESIAGDARYSVKLGFGESKEVAAVGPFKLIAQCHQNVTDSEGQNGRDVARVVIATAEAGSVLRSGVSNRDGSSADEMLNPTTAEGQRIVLEHSLPTGEAGFATSGHFTAMAPNGATASSPLGASSAALGYAGSACVLSGTVLGTH
jgi:hypothetical protein